MQYTLTIANMFELMVGIALDSRLATSIVRSQSDSMSSMTPSMHPKQRTIMQSIHILGNMFGLMIGIALNSRLATSLLPAVTRHRA